MDKEEAVSILEQCKPIYQKLLTVRDYELTEDEKGCLDKFRQVYEAGLADDSQVLEAAGVDRDEAALLVGYLYSWLGGPSSDPAK